MFDGVTIYSLFEGEGMPPEIDLLHEQLELHAGSASVSLHFGRESPGEVPASVTLTVLLGSPSRSVDAFVVAPSVSLNEPKPDTFFPAGKASLSEVGAGKAGLSEAERAGFATQKGFAGERAAAQSS
jgi:hypothetical protein